MSITRVDEGSNSVGRRRSTTSAPPLSELVEAAIASGSLKALLSLLKISASYYSHLVLQAEDGQLHRAPERIARSLHRYLHRASRCLREADELATDILEREGAGPSSSSDRDVSYHGGHTLSSHEFDSIRSAVEAAARAVVLAEQYVQEAERALVHAEDSGAAPASDLSGSHGASSRGGERSRHGHEHSAAGHRVDDQHHRVGVSGVEDEGIQAQHVDDDYEDDDENDNVPSSAPFTPLTPEERAVLARALGPKPSMLRMQLADVVKNAVDVSRSRSGSVLSSGSQGEDAKQAGSGLPSAPSSSAMPAARPGSARSNSTVPRAHNGQGGSTEHVQAPARVPSACDVTSSPVRRVPSAHTGLHTGEAGTARRVASVNEMVAQPHTGIDAAIRPAPRPQAHHASGAGHSPAPPFTGGRVGGGGPSPAGSPGMSVGNVIQTPMGPMVVVQGPQGPMAIPVAGPLGTVHSLVGRASQFTPSAHATAAGGPPSGVGSPEGKPLARAPRTAARSPVATARSRSRSRSTSAVRAPAPAPAHAVTEMTYDPKHPHRGRSPAGGGGSTEDARSSSRTRRQATSRSISRTGKRAKTPPTRYKPPQYDEQPQEEETGSSAEDIVTTLARKHSGIPAAHAR